MVPVLEAGVRGGTAELGVCVRGSLLDSSYQRYLKDIQVMQVKGNWRYAVRFERDLEFSPGSSWEAEAKAADENRGVDEAGALGPGSVCEGRHGGQGGGVKEAGGGIVWGSLETRRFRQEVVSAALGLQRCAQEWRAGGRRGLCG